MAIEKVILVDENDNPIGTEEKLRAHENANLHRAFSVFVFRKVAGEIEVLLQQRNLEKYHCGGLWTNTCCSHQRPQEDNIAAGLRRLQEEMGFVVNLQHFGSFIYKAEFDNGLTEHELDHVLVGVYNEEQINPNPLEVSGYAWLPLKGLDQEISENPHKYTPWLPKALKLVNNNYNKLIELLG